jgi:AFG3 family protein
MSKALGPIAYSVEDGYQKSYSDETGSLIDLEVRKIIDNALARCRELLSDKKDLV